MKDTAAVEFRKPLNLVQQPPPAVGIQCEQLVGRPAEDLGELEDEEYALRSDIP